MIDQDFEYIDDSKQRRLHELIGDTRGGRAVVAIASFELKEDREIVYEELKEKLTNDEWIDFLSKKRYLSREVALETNTADFVRGLASLNNVHYVRAKDGSLVFQNVLASDWSIHKKVIHHEEDELIAKNNGVTSDEIKMLAVALKKINIIDGKQMVGLLGAYQYEDFIKNHE